MSVQRTLVVVTVIAGLLLSTAALAKKKAPPAAPRETLETYLRAENVEYQDAAISFFEKMIDAGCKPAEAYRWTRMALFADSEWNLSDLVGIIEMQMLEGATRQVVEGEIEKRIKAQAKEMETDMSGFAAAFAKPVVAPGKKAKKRR